MTGKSKSKNTIVISDSSLYGADSDEELPSSKTVSKDTEASKKVSKSRSKSDATEQKTEQKTKTTKATKRIAMVNEFSTTITEYITEFLQSQGQGKVKIADVLASWQGEENQERLLNMVKLRMPVPEPAKTRKPKDPNAPKRPRSAYILFSNDKRPEIREAHPEMKMPEISKELGRMWGELKDKKKKPYLDQAAEDKKRYEAEMAKYKPDEKPKGPKRALTSYFFFCQDKRSEVRNANPEMKMTEVAKELGRMWKDDFADEKSRKKWVKLAEKDKERYTEEKASWVAEHPEDAGVPKKRGKSGKSEEAVHSEQSGDEAEPIQKKRKRKTPVVKQTGMVVFMQKTRPEIESENPDWSTKEVIAEMKKRWSALSADERTEYDE